MKRVLSLVIVIAMVLSSFTFAFAAEFEDVADIDYEKAINTLTGLGIVDGYEDGTFRPENIVTRAEMAKLMVEILGYGDLVAGAKSNFADTQGHWADSWISIAAGRNIVIGTGDGNFLPDRQVSYDEVLTMIVRGLGYTDDSNEIKSMTWPTNFKVKAAEIGITQDVKMATTGADRGGVAQALFNALDATLVSVNIDGDVRALQDNKQRDLPLITRIAVVAGDKDDPFEVLPKHLDSNHRDYAGDIVDLEQYLYEDVEAYASKADSKIIVYVAESFSDTVVGTVKKQTNEGEIKVELADKSVEILDWDEKTVDVYYNGKEVKLTEDEFENGSIEKNIVGLVGTGVAKVKVVEVDNDDDMDGDVKAVVVTNPTYAQRVASGYKKDATTIGRISLPTKGDDKVDLSKVTVTGDVDDINDIEDGDVVVAYAAAGTKNVVTPSFTELVVVRDELEGTITRVNKNTQDDTTTIYIDGEKYTRSEIDGRTDTFDVGFEGTFFLDDSGRLFAEDATSIADAKDYAIVIETYNGVKSAGGRTLANAEIRVITAGGEVVTYRVDKDTEYANEENVIDNSDLTFLDEDGNRINPIGDYLNQALVKIKVGSDNVVDRIDIVEDNVIGAKTKSNVDTTLSSFDLAANAPIFNIDVDGMGTDVHNKKYYSVVDEENLPKYIDFEYSNHNSSGAYNVIVSTNADKSSVGTYALITEVNYVLNDANVKVAEITAMVDGVERTFYGKDGNLVIGSVVDNGTIVKLDVSGNEVDKVTVVASKAGFVNQEIERVGSAGIRVNGAWEELSDEVAIYVLDKDVEYVGMTDASDLAGYQIVGIYETNSNIDGRDIVVVKPYAAVGTPVTPPAANKAVTFINGNSTQLVIDGVIYRANVNTVVRNANNTIIGLEDFEEVTVGDIVDVDGNTYKITKTIEEINAENEDKVNKEKAAAVEAKIVALPAVADLTLENKAAVEAAREAYDALNGIQKALVKNLNVLVAAEAKIEELAGPKGSFTGEHINVVEQLDMFTLVEITPVGGVTVNSVEFAGVTLTEGTENSFGKIVYTFTLLDAESDVVVNCTEGELSYQVVK